MFLLDTDTCVEILRGNERVIARRRCVYAPVVTTEITASELRPPGASGGVRPPGAQAVSVPSSQQLFVSSKDTHTGENENAQQNM